MTRFLEGIYNEDFENFVMRLFMVSNLILD